MPEYILCHIAIMYSNLLPCIVFVLQLPAYLPIHLARELYGRASAEFSITLLLVNLP